jgi:hypothetical protein
MNGKYKQFYDSLSFLRINLMRLMDVIILCRIALVEIPRVSIQLFSLPVDFECT